MGGVTLFFLLSSKLGFSRDVLYRCLKSVKVESRVTFLKGWVRVTNANKVGMKELDSMVLVGPLWESKNSLAFRNLRAFVAFRLAEKQFKGSDKRAKPSLSGSLDKCAGLISITTYLKICPACRKQRDWAFSLEGVLESCDSLSHTSAFSPQSGDFRAGIDGAPLP